MGNVFVPQKRIDDMAKNILKKRYFSKGETKWHQVVSRVVNYIAGDWGEKEKQIIYDMIYNRYFIPNSPTLVNAGKDKHAGLSACFVLPMEDTIEEIYKTKLDFALIARKGGGCGTTISHIRPEGDPVNGSTHGFAGGGVKFADTISHDMDAITQSGFRSMAIMLVQSVRHPDILKFIKAKEEEGRIENANISVMVDDEFMRTVDEDGEYWTEFNGKKYSKHKARDVFNQIVDGAWKNGEPGLLFYDTINKSPYRHANIKIESTNPCGEQPLPPYGTCNLGSIDVSKFVFDGRFDYELFGTAIRYGVRFLDAVIDVNSFPTPEIEIVAKKSRPVGLGIMGLADYYMKMKMAYGSEEALQELNNIMVFLFHTAVDESQIMGDELGVPEWCEDIPTPRRNITTVSIAPTGTISIIAGCNSGIEPFFSEITERKDKTGQYTINAPSQEEYFRCAVSSNGAREVTWQEHIATQSVAQKWCDSGVSKTINFPNHTKKETVYKAFFEAWSKGCKGITIYRNGSRKKEVLSPKNINRMKCPVCSAETVKFDGCTKCTSCEWSVCTVG